MTHSKKSALPVVTFTSSGRGGTTYTALQRRNCRHTGVLVGVHAVQEREDNQSYNNEGGV